GLPLPDQHAPPLGGQPVEAPAPLPGALQPAAADEPPALETAEHRVERGDPETELAARARFDALADVVPVPRPCLEQGQDQELGAALLQLATEHGVLVTWSHDILLRSIYRRTSPGVKSCRRGRSCHEPGHRSAREYENGGRDRALGAARRVPGTATGRSRP